MIRRILVVFALLAIVGAAFVWYAGSRLSAPVQRVIGGDGARASSPPVRGPLARAA